MHTACAAEICDFPKMMNGKHTCHFLLAAQHGVLCDEGHIYLGNHIISAYSAKIPFFQMLHVR